MKEEPKASIQGHSGLRVSVAHVALEDSLLELTTAAGIKLTWPIDDISLADFSAGKLMYLSDIEPASENWTPLRRPASIGNRSLPNTANPAAINRPSAARSRYS